MGQWLDTPPIPEEEMKTEKQKKWENFWFYHRWHVWIGAGLLIFLIIVFVQAAMVIKPDVEGMYVVSCSQDESMIDRLHGQLSRYVEDINGDDNRSLSLETLYIGAKGDAIGQVQVTYNAKFLALLQVDTMKLMVMDPPSFEAKLGRFLREDPTFFTPLEVTDEGYNEEYCYWDWYGSSYQQSDWGKCLPEHLYFAVRLPSPNAGEKEQLATEQAKQMLERFIRAASETTAE